MDKNGCSIYQLNHSPSRAAWSEGWQPPGTQLCIHRIKQLNSCNGFGHDDSSRNIITALLFIIVIIKANLMCKDVDVMSNIT